MPGFAGVRILSRWRGCVSSSNFNELLATLYIVLKTDKLFLAIGYLLSLYFN